MSRSVASTKLQISQYNSAQVRLSSFSICALCTASSTPSHFPRAMPAVIRKSHSLFNEHQSPVAMESTSANAESTNKHLAQQRGRKLSSLSSDNHSPNPATAKLNTRFRTNPSCVSCIPCHLTNLMLSAMVRLPQTYAVSFAGFSSERATPTNRVPNVSTKPIISHPTMDHSACTSTASSATRNTPTPASSKPTMRPT